LYLSLFNNLVYIVGLVTMLLLTANLVAHVSLSIAFGIRDVPLKDLIHESSIGDLIKSKYRTLYLDIYNAVYMTTEMVKHHNATSTDNIESPDYRDSAVVSMKRHGTANGLFPVYSLTIHGNGSVIYNGFKNVETSGVQTYQIPKDKAREIVNGFINIYYFALKDKYYDPSSASTLPLVTTSIIIGGKTKTVIDDHSSYAPVTLRALEDKIDQLSNSEKWVKPH
jgi:hypothetical protein